jgi:hypothetical protein
VVVPLLELAPSVRLPGGGALVDHADAVAGQAIERLPGASPGLPA